MVTVRQFSRGVGRTIRAMERDAQRAARQRSLDEKARARQAMLDEAADASEAYEDLIEILTGAHRKAFSRIDWLAAANAPLLNEPALTDVREQKAIQLLQAYRPSWLARTFGLAKGARLKLQKAVTAARHRDADDFAASCKAADERREQIAFAQEVATLKSKALISAINQHAELEEAPVEGINVLAVDGRVIAVINGLETEDMPRQSITLLQSGKASQKPLTDTKIHELHRDNVCSSAIRVAAEFLRVLPIDAVEILVEVDLLDRGSGHIMPQAVLYVRVAAQALRTVNLTLADPAPLIERLGGHLNWSRKDGLRPIDLEAFHLPPELLAEAVATD
jgi:hypothetical protein